MEVLRSSTTLGSLWITQSYKPFTVTNMRIPNPTKKLRSFELWINSDFMILNSKQATKYCFNLYSQYYKYCAFSTVGLKLWLTAHVRLLTTVYNNTILTGKEWVLRHLQKHQNNENMEKEINEVL
jgi:hypothetical protein